MLLILIIKTKDSEAEKNVFTLLNDKDPSWELEEQEGHTLKVVTTVHPFEVEDVPGVLEVINENDLCDCGSGKQKQALNDARSIFCCYVCEDCEQEKSSRYRPEVLTDSNYYADEPIDED